jgi:hypothetical protein
MFSTEYKGDTLLSNSGNHLQRPHSVTIQKGFHIFKYQTLFFFCWPYSPQWNLASSTIAVNWSRSCVFRLQFLTPITFRSSSIESSHLTAGLATVRIAGENPC